MSERWFGGDPESMMTYEINRKERKPSFEKPLYNAIFYK
jgi:hypothetical protein